MSDIPPVLNAIDGMDLEKLKILRSSATKRIKAIRKANKIRMEVVIPAELAIDLDQVIEWAYGQKLIKRKTRWSFSKFAVVNTVNMILQQIKEEKLREPQSEDGQTNRGPLDAQTPGKDTPEGTKLA